MKNAVPLHEMKTPSIVVRKAERSLELHDGGRMVKTYKIVLGFSPVGDKEIEGDGRTPEGEFYIFGKNPKSKYYLSLGVSYPNVEDSERGLETGLITKDEARAIAEAIRDRRTPPQKTGLGGEIYIHGGGNRLDWTEGCIGMRNADIRELFDSVGPGTPVVILP